MDTELSLSEVLHGNWLLEHESDVMTQQIHPIVGVEKKMSNYNLIMDEPQFDEAMIAEEVVDGRENKGPPIIPEKSMSVKKEQEISNRQFAEIDNDALKRPETPATASSQMFFYPSYATHGYTGVSPSYHQPFFPATRRKKKTSALKQVLQSPLQTFVPAYSYFPTFHLGYGSVPSNAPPPTSEQSHDKNNNEVGKINSHSLKSEFQPSSRIVHSGRSGEIRASAEEKGPSFTCSTSDRFSQPSPCFRSHLNRSYETHSGKTFDDSNVDNNNGQKNEKGEDGAESLIDERVLNIGDGSKLSAKAVASGGGLEDEGHHEKLIISEAVQRVASGDAEKNVNEGGADGGNVADTTATSSTAPIGKVPRSELEALLMQPVKKPALQEFPQFVLFGALGTSTPVAQQQSAKTMQFYQPPAPHLSRSTPPPGFAQPYGMGMRPHEEETRQIMNLDNQQTHNSSPTSSWNQPYPQMTNLNAYQQRGLGLYAPPSIHQNGPVVPTSNPYYQGPPGQPHHHMQPQAPMMPPGMPQQPYYNTQSPLTGTPPSMNYGTPGMPAPQATNGTAPIFNFSKPRNSNEGTSNSNGGVQRRKKHNDLSSPRYNSHGNEDVDASTFPDMSDFPLLDVVQSKAKKDAGRKPCRPHLCEQSRMLISRVCHFQREFIKRLPARHPLANSPLSKPDQWTSQIMGISLATVRKCVDMAVDEEVFTRCTDKNLVNLTPAERAEREELLSKLSTVFEDEKSLGAGTAGLTIAEYSPRRSYSTNLLRQNTDDKSSTSSYNVNGHDYGSAETTLLNLDDHSNSSKDFATPTPTMELSVNGSNVYEEIGAMRHDDGNQIIPKVDTPKRGRPRKAPGQASSNKQSRRKESIEDSEVSEDKDEHEKKTEDEDETNEESEKKTDDQLAITEREDDAASSEGTNRSETATPEPTALASPKKTRAARRKKRSIAEIDEEYSGAAKKKRGSVTAATAGIVPDDENAEHKMVTRARSRQP